jgi:hypothetical protein
MSIPYLATAIRYSRSNLAVIADMTLQTFREMLARRPFQPVKLTLSSGQSFVIRRPEMAMLTRSSILIGTDLAEDGVPQEFKIVSLLHVASMEPLSGQAA